MKCASCPFSLPCHAGRLDAGHKTWTLVLCVGCGQLQFGTEEDLYSFECEQRRIPKTARDNFAARVSVTALDAVQIEDLGPGLHGKLTLALCVACVPGGMASGTVGVFRPITYHLLDQGETHQLTAWLYQRDRARRAAAIPADEEESPYG